MKYRLLKEAALRDLMENENELTEGMNWSPKAYSKDMYPFRRTSDGMQDVPRKTFEMAMRIRDCIQEMRDLIKSGRATAGAACDIYLGEIDSYASFILHDTFPSDHSEQK